MSDRRIKAGKRQIYPFLMTPKLFFTRFNPTWKATLAYMALEYYASLNSQDCENVSIKTLARIMNVSEDTIKRGLAELEKKGVVKIYKRSRKSPQGGRIPLPSLYEIQNLQAIGGEPI